MTIILFSTLTIQLVDFAREIAGGKAYRSSVVTQLLAWIVGIVIIWLGANAAVTAELTLPGIDTPLGLLDGGSIILVGLLASSLASSIVDVKSAIDGSDSAAKPPLLPDATGIIRRDRPAPTRGA